MSAASPRPLKQMARVLAALAEGSEASQEIADATGIPRRQVRNALRRLSEDGAVVREPRPTFWLPGLGRCCFRYGLKGGAR